MAEALSGQVCSREKTREDAGESRAHPTQSRRLVPGFACPRGSGIDSGDTHQRYRTLPKPDEIAAATSMNRNGAHWFIQALANEKLGDKLRAQQLIKKLKNSSPPRARLGQRSHKKYLDRPYIKRLRDQFENRGSRLISLSAPRNYRT